MAPGRVRRIGQLVQTVYAGPPVYRRCSSARKRQRRDLNQPRARTSNYVAVKAILSGRMDGGKLSGDMEYSVLEPVDTRVSLLCIVCKNDIMQSTQFMASVKASRICKKSPVFSLSTPICNLTHAKKGSSVTVDHHAIRDDQGP